MCAYNIDVVVCNDVLMFRKSYVIVNRMCVNCIHSVKQIILRVRSWHFSIFLISSLMCFRTFQKKACASVQYKVITKNALTKEVFSSTGLWI